MTEPRNDENLEGIQGLARGLGRLLPRGGARGEAIRKLLAESEYEFLLEKALRTDAAEARAEAAERERNNAIFYEGRMAAKLAAVREAALNNGKLWADEVLAILDGEGEK